MLHNEKKSSLANDFNEAFQPQSYGSQADQTFTVIAAHPFPVSLHSLKSVFPIDFIILAALSGRASSFFKTPQGPKITLYLSLPKVPLDHCSFKLQWNISFETHIVQLYHFSSFFISVTNNCPESTLSKNVGIPEATTSPLMFACKSRSRTIHPLILSFHSSLDPLTPILLATFPNSLSPGELLQSEISNLPPPSGS